MNKATHLRNFVDRAMYYFSIAKPTSPSEEAKKKRSRMMAKMRVVYEYLGQTAARAKRDAYLEKAARNRIIAQGIASTDLSRPGSGRRHPENVPPSN